MKFVVPVLFLPALFALVPVRGSAHDLDIVLTDQTRRVVLKEAFLLPGSEPSQEKNVLLFFVTNHSSEDDFILSAFIDSDTKVALFEIMDQRPLTLAVFSRLIALQRSSAGDMPYAASLVIPEEETREYMVYLSDNKPVRLELWSRNFFTAVSAYRRFLLGLFYGAIAILVLSQFAFFAMLRDPCYLWFSIFMILLCSAIAYWDGTAVVAFHPAGLSSAVSMYFSNLASLSLGCFYLFLRGFLELRRNMPRLNTAALVLAIVHAVLTPAQILFQIALFPQIVSALGILLILLFFVACVDTLRKRFRPAIFLVIGFTVLAVTILLTSLQLFGVPLRIGLGSVLYYPSTLILAIFLIAALADRVRIIRADQERAARLNVAMGDFFTNLSHEMRTPLMLISNYLDSYERSVPPSRELLIIRKNVGKLVRDVSQFFEVLRFEKGIVPTLGGAAALSDILRERIAVFVPTAEKARLRVESDIEEGLAIAADQTSVECILDNLIDNAMKYNREGGVVRIEARRRGEQAELIVRDTGIGIAADQLQKIFLPYVQISQPKGNRQGIGMGLCLVKRTIEALNGSVRVESKPGEGSAFHVLFPLSTGTVAAEPDGPAHRAPHPAPPPPPPPRPEQPVRGIAAPAAGGPRSGLLVVEDSEDLRELLADSFSATFSVRTASNGAEALRELAGMDSCSAIVSDIMMDGMDGSQLLEAVRADPRYAEIPFILITAKTEQADRLKSLAGGAVDYIVKPFNVEELGFKLLNLTRRFEAERRRQEAEHRQRLEVMLGELSHEIKNPLSGITGPAANLRVLLDSSSFGERGRAGKYLALIERNSARIATLLADVNAFLYRRSLDRKAVSISRLMREVAGKCRALNVGVTVRFEHSAGASVWGDEAAASKIFENILMNAADAMEGKGTITVEASHMGENTEIRICDTGPGIPAEDLGKIFDPFFTTKEIGKGLGLGLSVVKDLAAAMGWAVEAAPGVGPGAVFVIRAPTA
jgi:signal transduction histidine kinase